MTEQQKKDFRIINGNNLEVLDTFEENSIDAIVTDPPYGLTSITKRFGKENSAPCKEGKDGSFARLSKGFMGKEWDGSGIEYNIELWKRALRVLKPGGYLLAFGGSRTFHRIACAIEDAGFEIRDTIMWLYGSGFPKSHNVGLDIDKLNGVESETIQTKTIKKLATNGMINYEKEGWRKGGYDIEYSQKKANNEWNGWGTALKPAFEPIIMARKPIEDTVAINVLKYGTGAINIDECRVPFESTQNPATNPLYRKQAGYKLPEKEQESNGAVKFTSSKNDTNELGRFPANVITDGSDEVAKGMPNTKSSGSEANWELSNADSRVPFISYQRKSGVHFEDEGSAMRYFYQAKASKKDRDEGLKLFEEKQTTDGCIRSNNETARKFGANSALRKNIHPTVKPVELMQYLVRLVVGRGGLY